jgi:hypothetical protein
MSNKSNVQRCLTLHGTRRMSFVQTGICFMPATLFTWCLLQLMVGSGYFSGLCMSPLRPEERVREFVFEKYGPEGLPCQYY